MDVLVVAMLSQPPDYNSYSLVSTNDYTNVWALLYHRPWNTWLIIKLYEYIYLNPHINLSLYLKNYNFVVKGSDANYNYKHLKV